MTETNHTKSKPPHENANWNNNDQNKSNTNRDSDWPSVLYFIHVHLLATYGLWLLLTDTPFLTIVLFTTLCLLGIIGITCGAHRLWAHRTYKANTFLRVMLMLCQTLAGQGPIYDWVQLHRLHHEHFGTDGDPYNHNKGFLYSHIITNFKALSPYQEQLKSKINMTDIEDDKIVMFQKRFFWILYIVVFLLLPINAPMEYWGDSILNAIFIMGFLRCAVVLHATWLVHSAIHVWGLRPGEKYPADTNLVFIITKSYWPQYHYLLPNDYKSGEFGTYGKGCSTNLIRIWAVLGWATYLRTIDSECVRKALSSCIKTGKPIEDCLKEAEDNQQLKEDHFILDEN